MKNTNKKVYSAPQLTVHGDATQLTQQTNSGGFFDRVFGTIITPGLPLQMS